MGKKIISLFRHMVYSDLGEIFSMDIREKVFEIIRRNASNLETNNLIMNDESRLIEDLNYDSVDMINLVMDIEGEFNIEFDDMELLIENMNCVQNLVKIVMCRLSLN